MGAMTRDHARAEWAKSGLTYADLTPENLRLLRGTIDRGMRTSGLMRGTFRASQRFVSRLASAKPWADLRCQSYYFDDRQALTFGSDGFVGFAGWADDSNVQPILIAFSEWVAILARLDQRKEEGA